MVEGAVWQLGESQIVIFSVVAEAPKHQLTGRQTGISGSVPSSAKGSHEIRQDNMELRLFVRLGCMLRCSI